MVYVSFLRRSYNLYYSFSIILRTYSSTYYLTFTTHQVTLKEEQSSYFTELLTQVNMWMSSMERRVENLDPVAMDIQLIEDQIESIQVNNTQILSDILQIELIMRMFISSVCILMRV